MEKLYRKGEIRMSYTMVIMVAVVIVVAAAVIKQKVTIRLTSMVVTMMQPVEIVAQVALMGIRQT